MIGDDTLDDTDIALTRRIILTVAGVVMLLFWIILIVLDMPGILWEDGDRMLLELYDPISLINPLSVGLALLGFGALGKKEKKDE